MRVIYFTTAPIITIYKEIEKVIVSNHCFNKTMVTNNDVFYPSLVCDIGRSRTLSLQFKLP